MWLEHKPVNAKSPDLGATKTFEHQYDFRHAGCICEVNYLFILLKAQLMLVLAAAQHPAVLARYQKESLASLEEKMNSSQPTFFFSQIYTS